MSGFLRNTFSLAILFSLFYLQMAQAADDNSERWYSVEIIIFEHSPEYRYDQEQQPKTRTDYSLIENAVELIPSTFQSNIQTNDISTITDELPVNPDGENISIANVTDSTATEVQPVSVAITTDPAPDTNLTNEQATPSYHPAPFSIPDPDTFVLNDKAQKLMQSSRVKVLLHTAWLQPGLDREHAIPVHISNEIKNVVLQQHAAENPLTSEKSVKNSGAGIVATETISDGIPLKDESLEMVSEDNEISQTSLFDEIYTADDTVTTEKKAEPMLDGVITVKLSRYLHMDFDIEFTEFRPKTKEPEISTPLKLADSRSSVTTSLYQSDNEMVVQETEVNTIFKLQHSRKMRSRELHYIDHPRIGILAYITPIEIPETATDLQTAE